MKWKEWVYERILPGCLELVVRAIIGTLKVRSFGESALRAMYALDKRVVYVFWHDRAFFLIPYMARRNIHIIVSTSRDGLLMANVLSRFRYGVIPGSSDKSPVRAVIRSIQTLREGHDVAFAADGPRGPRHALKPGAVFLAKKSGAPVVPASWSASSSWFLRSWDRFIVPRPFARIVIRFGAPMRLSAVLSESPM